MAERQKKDRRSPFVHNKYFWLKEDVAVKKKETCIDDTLATSVPSYFPISLGIISRKHASLYVILAPVARIMEITARGCHVLRPRCAVDELPLINWGTRYNKTIIKRDSSEIKYYCDALCTPNRTRASIRNFEKSIFPKPASKRDLKRKFIRKQIIILFPIVSFAKKICAVFEESSISEN